MSWEETSVQDERLLTRRKLHAWLERKRPERARVAVHGSARVRA